MTSKMLNLILLGTINCAPALALGEDSMVKARLLPDNYVIANGRTKEISSEQSQSIHFMLEFFKNQGFESLNDEFGNGLSLSGYDQIFSKISTNELVLLKLDAKPLNSEHKNQLYLKGKDHFWSSETEEGISYILSFSNSEAQEVKKLLSGMNEHIKREKIKSKLSKWKNRMRQEMSFTSQAWASKVFTPSYSAARATGALNPRAQVDRGYEKLPPELRPSAKRPSLEQMSQNMKACLKGAARALHDATVGEVISTTKGAIRIAHGILEAVFRPDLHIKRVRDNFNQVSKSLRAMNWDNVRNKLKGNFGASKQLTKQEIANLVCHRIVQVGAAGAKMYVFPSQVSLAVNRIHDGYSRANYIVGAYNRLVPKAAPFKAQLFKRTSVSKSEVPYPQH